jgi:polyphenol oxidase
VNNRPNPLTSPLLDAAGFRHAFFSCEGGVSTGQYATLNFSYSVGDDPHNVVENLSRAAVWLGIATDGLYFAQQVHGRHAITLRSDLTSEAVRLMKADAIVGSNSAQACCVRTADCVPVLVADRIGGQVAAIHAGWRGVAGGIVPETLLRLFETGCKPENLIACIGPHIRVGAFEVSEAVAEQINQATPGFDVVRRTPGQLPHVSLAESLIEQLRRAGISHNQVEDVGGCTFAQADRFFSYRRSGQSSGRHLHAILPRGPLR